MTQRPIGVTDVASGAGVAEYRTRERSVGGDTVVEQYILLIEDRVPSFVGAASTFKDNTATVVKSTLENQAGSGVLVAVRQVVAIQEANAASTTVRFNHLNKATSVTGGTTMTKVSVGTGANAAETSSASVVCKGSTASDATLSTTTTLAATVGTRYGTLGPANRQSATYEGQILGEVQSYPPNEHSLLPNYDTPLILRAGEAAAVVWEPTASNTYITACSWLWEEYLLP